VPAGPDDVVFVDGWAISYDRVLTTFDHITLSEGPDKSSTDRSKCGDGKGGTTLCGTGGSVVAELDGPFVVDLHKGGPLADADGAAMDAVPVAALTGRNKQGNHRQAGPPGAVALVPAGDRVHGAVGRRDDVRHAHDPGQRVR